MTNLTTAKNQRVRFEEVTPTNDIVAYFNTQLSSLVAGKGLPIFLGYDDLDDIQFVHITLPSGNTVVLGQYEHAPEIGVDLYVNLNGKITSTSISTNIPALVVETLQYLSIPREIAIWFHEEYETEIDRLYTQSEKREPIFRPEIEAIPPIQEREPIDCFYYALEIYTRDKMPEYWAMLQHNLGLAYYHRTRGERWENLLKSIACFNASLEVFGDRDKYLQKWQINQEDLQQSQAAWKVEKQNLIKDILDRGGESLNLSGADLSGTNLSGADLSGADLSGAYLQYANLSGANLNGANLNGATLSGATLSSATLSGAKLGFANLLDANLPNINLVGADLISAYLNHANLSGAKLNGASLKGAYLNHAHLSGADLSYADLRGANLSNTDLSNADVTDTEFGYNEGISELRQRDLILRGAIFSDNLGDPVEYPIPVGR
jgi:uncharacterized protein YjbI with pentapeptide repeats